MTHKAYLNANKSSIMKFNVSIYATEKKQNTQQATV